MRKNFGPLTTSRKRPPWLDFMGGLLPKVRLYYIHNNKTPNKIVPAIGGIKKSRSVIEFLKNMCRPLLMNTYDYRKLGTRSNVL